MCETYRYAVMRYTPQRQPLHHRIQPILQTNLKTNCQLLEDLDLSFQDLPAAVHGPPVFNCESTVNQVTTVEIQYYSATSKLSTQV